MKMTVDTMVMVPLNQYPLIDDTDFKTREVTITFDESGMDLVWNFTTTDGIRSQTAVTPTEGSDGDYDWVHEGDGMYSVEIPASGGASVNNDTEGFGWWSGICDGVLPWAGPVVQFSPANVIASMVDGSDRLEVDAKEINSVAQRAIDLAEFAQYIFANAATLTDIIANDSVQAQVMASSGIIGNYSKVDDALQSIRDAITATSPQSHEAIANNETTGTLDSGTFADTVTVNNVYYQVSPAGAAVGGFGLNCDLTFNIGVGRVPSQAIVTGYFDAAALRTVQVWAYDYILADYVQVSNSTNDFGKTVANQSFIYPLAQNMVQVSDGEVKIRFTSTSTTIGDDWYCDFVDVTSIEQAGAGLTADAIQSAVWARSSFTADHDEDTLGYVISNIFIVQGEIGAVTNDSQFIIDADAAGNYAYNGNVIVVEDEDTGFYETRRIINYIGATKEVFLDRDLSFTPATGDHYYIMGTGYCDVNTTHISGTAQTANDNGADINTILTVLGALADVAADGDPTNTDTVMQYMKQLINILIGTIGIVNFPAEGAPANNISLAEVIRAIYNDVTGINGDVMRGTDGANTAVPDVAGTAAGLHGTTDGLIGGLNDFDPANDTVVDVTNVGTTTTNSDMRGTDGANTTVPDAAGTAAGLHGTTDGLINGLNNITAASVWAVGTRTLTSFGTLVADTATAVWDKATSALTTVGSIGKKLSDWVLGSDDKVLLSANAQTGVTIPTVTTVGTTTTNTDMRGTDSAATETKQDIIDGNVDDIKAKTDNLPASPAAVGSEMALTDAAVDKIHDEVVEGTITLRQATRLFLAVLTGKTSGSGSPTIIFRDTGDTKNRLSITVDEDNNRTAVGTRDGS